MGLHRRTYQATGIVNFEHGCKIYRESKTLDSRDARYKLWTSKILKLSLKLALQYINRMMPTKGNLEVNLSTGRFALV